MVTKIVECIPNFSEARNPVVIQHIRDAINTVSGATIIDQHADIDHNRSVITMIGSLEAMENAAFEAIKTAAELIDLNQHTGQHPRIGATDVVPFVPIQNCTIIECIEVARRLGKRVGEELNIPVYLYEEAATKPERHRLENVRRGQFEGLKKEINSNPARLPDFGPNRLPNAGATAIGARHALIAFNVYLVTADPKTAKKIASVIRHSSGGLRGVKALGMSVNGLAQVSMNLTDFNTTALHHVIEMIRREALRYGTAIHHSELVGLIPQKALINSAQWYLQLDQFSPDQILESRIASATSPALPPVGKAPINRLAAKTTSEFSTIITTGTHSCQLLTQTCRTIAEQSKSAETIQRFIGIIERIELVKSKLSQQETRLVNLKKDSPQSPYTPASNPEQVANYLELKEQHQKLIAAQLSELMDQIAEIILLIELIHDNDGNNSKQIIATCLHLTKGTFLAISNLLSQEIVQIRDTASATELSNHLNWQTNKVNANCQLILE